MSRYRLNNYGADVSLTVPTGAEVGAGPTSLASVIGFSIVGLLVFRYLLGGSR